MHFHKHTVCTTLLPNTAHYTCFIAQPCVEDVKEHALYTCFIAQPCVEDVKEQIKKCLPVNLPYQEPAKQTPEQLEKKNTIIVINMMEHMIQDSYIE